MKQRQSNKCILFGRKYRTAPLNNVGRFNTYQTAVKEGQQLFEHGHFLIYSNYAPTRDEQLGQ